MKYTIYTLIDPITNEIRYVGQTYTSTGKRLSCHISEAKRKLPDGKYKNTDHKNRWIRKLIKIGVKPLLTVIGKYATEKEVNCAETAAIRKHIGIGCKLTNNQSGGTYGSRIISVLTRKKLKTSAKLAAAKTRKPVVKYSLNGKFIKEYKGVTNTPYEKRQISACCNNKIKSAYGYQWRFKLSDDFPRQIEPYTTSYGTPVLQYGLDGMFLREYNQIPIEFNNIYRSCVSKTKAGEYQWRFKLSDDFPRQIEPYKEINVGLIFSKPVIQYSTQKCEIERYVSLTDAISRTGISTIGMCCNKKLKTAGGYLWEWDTKS